MQDAPAFDAQDKLRYPHPEPPLPGAVIEVAPGILWTRLPLPFRLDHVNVYLIEDEGGWAVFDTGIANGEARAVWDALLAGPLAGRRLTRVIATHYHPDHIGLAGWLCGRFGTNLLTSQTAYLGCINISLSPGAMSRQIYRDFYARHGMAPETIDRVTTLGHDYLRLVSPLPPVFTRLVAGDTLRLGKRDFAVLSGDGHAPEQLMLYAAGPNVLLAADQVLAKITPNVSVWAAEPDGDPLGLYLRSLKAIVGQVPADALVLPGHQLPFYGLHARCAELARHHDERCRIIARACAGAPRSVAELVPVLFHSPLDPHQLGFAFSEAQAHVNAMVRKGELAWDDAPAGVLRVRPRPQSDWDSP